MCVCVGGGGGGGMTSSGQGGMTSSWEGGMTSSGRNEKQWAGRNGVRDRVLVGIRTGNLYSHQHTHTTADDNTPIHQYATVNSSVLNIVQCCIRAFISV